MIIIYLKVKVILYILKLLMKVARREDLLNRIFNTYCLIHCGSHRQKKNLPIFTLYLQIVTSGQVPILTFLQAPSSILSSSACSQMYNRSAPCCCHHDNRYLINQQPMVHERRVSRKAQYIQPDPKVRRLSIMRNLWLWFKVI